MAEVQTQNPPVQTKRRPRRNSRTGLYIIIGVVVLAAITTMMVLNGKKETGVSVEVQTVSYRPITQTVTATGVVDPETQVKISSEVSGEIIFLGVKEGDRVQKGQVLVRINPSQMMAQLDEARASIASAQARMAQAKANLLRAQQELARIEQLHEKKLSTQQELETAQTQVRVNSSEVDAARYLVEQNQASFRNVQQSVSKTTIVSPISGIVTKLNSKLGEKVVGAIQMTGTEIMTIADISVIEAVVDVPETDVVQVHMGDTAEVEVDAMPGERFLAEVSQIANSPKQSGVNTQEQMTNFEVHLRFINPDARFRPGMTATSTIRTARNLRALAVPIQAVTTRSKRDTVKEEEDPAVRNVKEREQKDDRPKPIVFVKTGDSVAARPVTTGIRDDQFIEILSGLKQGDTIISGNYKAVSRDLEEGSKISVANAKAKKNDTKGKK